MFTAFYVKGIDGWQLCVVCRSMGFSSVTDRIFEQAVFWMELDFGSKKNGWWYTVESDECNFASEILIEGE